MKTRRMKWRDWKGMVFNLTLAAEEAQEMGKDSEQYIPRMDGEPCIEVPAQCFLDMAADLEDLDCLFSTGKWPEEFEA